MPGRVVERGEVVVVELDLGPLDDAVAESRRRCPRARGASSSAGAGGRRRAGSPGRVTSIASSRRRSSSSPRAERCRSARRSAPRAPGAPRCRCLPSRGALLLRQGRDRAQDLRQLRLAPQVADPQLLELLGRASPRAPRARLPPPGGRVAPSPAGGRAARQASVGRQSMQTMAFVQAEGRRHRDVERVGPSGDRDRGRPRRRRPRARRAGPARSAPSTNNGAPAARQLPQRRCPPRGRARHRPPAGRSAPRARSRGPRAGRRSRPCWPAPPSGRTDRPSAGSARPSGAERLRRAQDRADVAGIGDVVQVERPASLDGGLGARARPARQTPITRDPAPEAARAGQRHRGRPATRLGSVIRQQSRGDALGIEVDRVGHVRRGSARRPACPRPRPRSSPVRSRCLRSWSLRSSFRCGVALACDRSRSCLVSVEQKRAADLAGRRPGW